MNTTDFNRSYLRFRLEPAAQAPITVTGTMPTLVNNVRINLECRCELTHRPSGRRHTYILGASCKTERVGVERDCWMLPNADFCLVASEDEFLVIKSWAQANMPVADNGAATQTLLDRQSGSSREAWTTFDFKLRPASGQALTSLEQIIGAIQSDRSINARTEYIDGDWNVMIEHPVKTINYSEVDKVYQTDTGPVLLPDLSADRLARGPRLIDCFDLAYSAFNSASWTEFIVNVPTPISDGARVNHYSKSRRIEPVQNVLVEVLEDAPANRLTNSNGNRAIRTDGVESTHALKRPTGSAINEILTRDVQPAR